MDTLRIQTAQNVEITYEAAGLGDRIVAAIIDGLVQGAYLIVAALLLGGTTAFLIFGLGPVLLYHLLCEVFFRGQSLGKNVVNVRVARVDGTPPGLGAYVLRWLLRPVEIWMTLGTVAMLAILLGKTGQRIGDRAAGTTVVRVRQHTSLAETGLVERPEADEPPHYPEAALLSSEDVQTVRAVLQQYRSMGKTGRSERLVRRAKEAVERKMGVPPVDVPPQAFLLQVLRDYHAEGGER